MESKGKEKGILKIEPRQPRFVVDTKLELTPQGSYERPPSSPQPSVDRLSVTWADPGSMTSSGVNLFQLPSEANQNNEVKFSPSTGDGSEDEDYSASLSAVLRQRRASVRRSRKGRARRPSSPFLADDIRSRRRSSVFTTSSGDTAISIDDQPVVTQEQIFENIHIHKEVLVSVKQQPLSMRKKLKIVRQAKRYIKSHEGQLQERLAQSKSTRDIYARFNILLATKWQQLKREAANTSNLLIPWELRIKEIESHFGSVVASYFTFLRWLFWVNLVIGFILLVFVIIPECLTANPMQDGERKIIMEDERRNATNLLTLWEFEGILKYSPIFYGYYSNVERAEYRMPLAYFLTGLVVYIYSFVAILRKMAENSRMSKLSEKEDECIFSWKLFTGWDFMIGNAETAHNRIASVNLGFKEALLEEAEKKKNLRNWRTISLRALVNICVIILLVVSAYAVVTVVSRSDDNPKVRNWWRENETTTVVTVISITFPVIFELLGYLERYHPRNQLRLQLARIMVLNLLNLYSLIFALFSKIEGMSKDLVSLQPSLHTNVTNISDNSLYTSEPLGTSLHISCFETTIPCLPCDMINLSDVKSNHQGNSYHMDTTVIKTYEGDSKIKKRNLPNSFKLENDEEAVLAKEIERIQNLSKQSATDDSGDMSEIDDNEGYDFDNDLYFSTDLSTPTSTTNIHETDTMDSNKLYTETVTLLGTTNTPETTESYLDTSPSSEKNENTELTESTVDLSTYSTTSEKLYSTSSLDIITNSYDTNNYSDTTMYNLSNESSTNKFSSFYSLDLTTDLSFTETTNTATTVVSHNTKNITVCPDLSFNCSVNCGNNNITQIFFMSNCTLVDLRYYINQCSVKKDVNSLKNITNITLIDIAYTDSYNRKAYNLTVATKKKLLKLCWETMFGQELIKLTMMDLVFVLMGTLFMDFFRALFVRYMNKCWCWDLEKKCPEYGDFKIAENILHLINNQGMVWMGMFFSPGLVVLNIFKLIIMMYLRSWAVMTCNVPHEVVFRVSKSNNFYLALLLTMLFLCVLPVGYTIVWVTPSWHCGPFSEYDKIYKILTTNIYKVLPKSLNFTLEYIASPAIVIPLLVLLILIIYYLTSLTNSLREANNDLKIQLKRERTEERKKMLQLANTRRRGGSSSMDNTPFARWKKALPTLPQTKSIDSDDRKNYNNDNIEVNKTLKRKGGIFAKIVGLAIDKKTNGESILPSCTDNIDGESDSKLHDGLPKEILKIKDITITRDAKVKKKGSIEFNIQNKNNVTQSNVEDDVLEVQNSYEENFNKNSTALLAQDNSVQDFKYLKENITNDKIVGKNKTTNAKVISNQRSDSNNLLQQNDSIGSVIPVITISATESDDEVLQTTNDDKKEKDNTKSGYSNKEVLTNTEMKKARGNLKRNKNCSDLKSLQRQSSVDSINEKTSKEKKTDDTGHKYQYSL